MNRHVLALGSAATFVMVAAVALSACNANQPGGDRSATPSPLPTTSPESTPLPEASAAEPTFSALTETFTSDIHGMSASYPSGWQLRPATEPWNGDLVQQDSPFADVIYVGLTPDPVDRVGMAIARVLGDTVEHSVSRRDSPANSYLKPVPADRARPDRPGALKDPESGSLATTTAGGV